MKDARIGRVLAASLHQAIGEVVPTRLEFYEHWLHSDGLRHGGIGLAPMAAVLGFLRTEEAYPRIVARAGDCAATWVVEDLSSIRRRVLTALPPLLRMRAALGVYRSLVRQVYPRSRAAWSVRRSGAQMELRGSLFCDVREPGATPRCGFYAAAVSRVLDLFALEAHAEIASCRAAGAGRCTLSIALGRSPGR